MDSIKKFLKDEEVIINRRNQNIIDQLKNEDIEINRDNITPVDPINPIIHEVDSDLINEIIKQNFINNLSNVNDYIKSNKRNLIMADIYASKFGEEGIYENINSKPESWAIMIAMNMNYEINQFLKNPFRYKKQVATNMNEDLAQNILNSYLKLNYKNIQEFSPIKEQGYILVLDTLFNITPPYTQVNNLREMTYERMDKIGKYLKNNNLQTNNINSIKNLDAIREIKFN